MAKKYCEHCGREYDNNNYECPNCNIVNESYPLNLSFKYMNWVPAWKQVVLFIVGYGVLQIFTIIISSIIQNVSMSSEWRTLWCNSGAYILTIATLCFVLWDDLLPVLKRFTKLRPYVFGIGYGALLIGAGVLYNYILMVCNVKIETGGNQNAVIAITKASPALAFFMIVIFGPVSEELTYRLGLFNLSRRANRLLAYVITMIVFGLIHFDWSSSNLTNEALNLPSYVISGLILCYAYEREGIACSTTAHVINNLVSFISIIVSINTGA